MAIVIQTRDCCRNTVCCGSNCLGCKTPRWFSYDAYCRRNCQYSNITITVLTHNIQHQTSQPKLSTSVCCTLVSSPARPISHCQDTDSYKSLFKSQQSRPEMSVPSGSSEMQHVQNDNNRVFNNADDSPPPTLTPLPWR
jgi:hypothetical protein